MASTFSISRAWDETRDIFRRDGGLYVAVALAMIVLPEVIVGIIAPDPGNTPSGGVQLLRLLAGLIALVGQLSIIRLAIGPSTTVRDAIRHGVRRFPSALGAIILLVIAMMLITIPLVLVLAPLLGADVAHMTAQPKGPEATLILIVLLIIIAISVRFTLLSPVSSAEEIGPIAILKRTWNLTTGRYWRLAGFVGLLLIAAIFLLFTAGIIGGLLAKMVSPNIEPFSIGALILSLVAGAAQGIFSVMAALMLARVYAQVAARDGEASVPSSGT